MVTTAVAAIRGQGVSMEAILEDILRSSSRFSGSVESGRTGGIGVGGLIGELSATGGEKTASMLAGPPAPLSLEEGRGDGEQPKSGTSSSSERGVFFKPAGDKVLSATA